MLREEISKKSSIIEKEINKYLKIQEPEELYKASRHLISAGGKRLRPVLSLISTEAIGEDYRKILPAAIAIEIIHNFTLIHDDIMDKDVLRRGVPTVHVKWDEPTAILAGDTLFAKAFEIITECDVEPENLVKASRMLAEVCISICEGQYLDMNFEDRAQISEEEYIDMVKKKTAVLIAASCSLPAVLFGKDKKIVDTLWNFGLLSGTAFQIHDDVLDIIGGEKIGKDWCSDIVEGKKTIIIIKAIESGVNLEIFGKGNADEKEKKMAVEKLMKCGAIEYAKSKARHYLNEAKSSLSLLDESPARNLLEEIADYLISREY
ncbi:MAG TPA: polyprenyl synthetase family protein [Archaeoglobaceae archaeon]|nr:polyprenyl synthetase family protein [Archaeoglobaceae archaeon]